MKLTLQLNLIKQSVFVVTRYGVAVVDAPPASRGTFKEGHSFMTDKPVSHSLFSHSPLDHVGGVTDFYDAVRIAHDAILERTCR
ncbi:hypothetical protein AQI88_00210 [Streptomyces cellostaticus]|uniref:Metallo-beta-lactamase domain-containing protein n=1 Tax=Streptomyces cellostaticus TaxID=67285 RepID=A0A101NTX0_9ACTN|nr:hypothetical protein [Streptomyces cellostaticus]KUM99032.1 hypothetical protein AQI88_00210 [Streptomyces cellostaticus]GHI03502.1 hypothetical protein Scel_18230 [Streptomyces cellostaticus]